MSGVRGDTEGVSDAGSAGRRHPKMKVRWVGYSGLGIQSKERCISAAREGSQIDDRYRVRALPSRVMSCLLCGSWRGQRK